MRKSEAEKVMLLLNEIERCERSVGYLEKISVNNIQIRNKDSGLLVELLPKARERTKEIREDENGKLYGMRWNPDDRIEIGNNA